MKARSRGFLEATVLFTLLIVAAVFLAWHFKGVIMEQWFWWEVSKIERKLPIPIVVPDKKEKRDFGEQPPDVQTPLFDAHAKTCPQCGNTEELVPLCEEGFTLLQKDLENSKSTSAAPTGPVIRLYKKIDGLADYALHMKAALQAAADIMSKVDSLEQTKTNTEQPKTGWPWSEEEVTILFHRPGSWQSDEAREVINHLYAIGKPAWTADVQKPENARYMRELGITMVPTVVELKRGEVVLKVVGVELIEKRYKPAPEQKPVPKQSPACTTGTCPLR